MVAFCKDLVCHITCSYLNVVFDQKDSELRKTENSVPLGPSGYYTVDVVKLDTQDSPQDLKPPLCTGPDKDMWFHLLMSFT